MMLGVDGAGARPSCGKKGREEGGKGKGANEDMPVRLLMAPLTSQFQLWWCGAVPLWLRDRWFYIDDGG